MVLLELYVWFFSYDGDCDINFTVYGTKGSINDFQVIFQICLQFSQQFFHPNSILDGHGNANRLETHNSQAASNRWPSNILPQHPRHRLHLARHRQHTGLQTLLQKANYEAHIVKNGLPKQDPFKDQQVLGCCRVKIGRTRSKREPKILKTKKSL